MRDCPNVVIRELLPDLLHDRLSAAQAAEVRAHLDECAECRAELALLRAVRDSVSAPRVDVQRVVNALPPYRPAPLWQRLTRSPGMRAAAAVLLLAGGVTIVARNRGDSPGTLPPDSTARVANLPAPRRDVRPPIPTELPLGETFDDVSDSELRALADQLGRLEAVLLTEPDDVVVPIPDVEGT